MRILEGRARELFYSCTLAGISIARTMRASSIHNNLSSMSITHYTFSTYECGDPIPN